MHCDLYVTCTPHSFPVPDLNNQVPALLLKVTDNGETDPKDSSSAAAGRG
jgi:hypothetical protein